VRKGTVGGKGEQDELRESAAGGGGMTCERLSLARLRALTDSKERKNEETDKQPRENREYKAKPRGGDVNKGPSRVIQRSERNTV